MLPEYTLDCAGLTRRPSQADQQTQLGGGLGASNLHGLVHETSDSVDGVDGKLNEVWQRRRQRGFDLGLVRDKIFGGRYHDWLRDNRLGSLCQCGRLVGRVLALSCRWLDVIVQVRSLVQAQRRLLIEVQGMNGRQDVCRIVIRDSNFLKDIVRHIEQIRSIDALSLKVVNVLRQTKEAQPFADVRR
jgi:hypothetical protein